MSTKHYKPSARILLLLALGLLLAPFQPLQTALTSAQTARTAAPLTRGAAGDLWADVIVGKPAFSDIGPNTTTGGKLFWPHGVIVDRSDPNDNKMYVYDAGNNRILGFHLSACLGRNGDPAGCTADIVIGQPNMSGAGCNGDSAFQSYPNRAPASASSLCGQPENTLSVSETGSGASMAVDGAGNLYVPDFWNHRVLKYNNPFASDTVADDVWGQNDFSGNSCNKSLPFPDPRTVSYADAGTLCFSWGRTNAWTAGVDVDPQGNLWVADSGNNRVLRFPPGSHTADLVIGQPDLSAKAEGGALNQLKTPVVVRVNSRGWLYVADHGNNRVMVYQPPFAMGMSGRVFGSGLSAPSGIDFDPGQPGVWIVNTIPNSLERWDEDSGALVEVLGRKGAGNLIDRASGSVGIDSNGNKYVSIGTGVYANDVLMFGRGASPTQPTRRLFGAGIGNEVTAASISAGGGVAVSDNQLIVADQGRILSRNDPASLSIRKPADGATGGVGGPNESKRGCCITLKADRNHHLWVSAQREAASPTRIMLYALPLTNGAPPILTLAYPFNVLGGGQIADDTVYGPFWGIAPTDNSEFLWVSQSGTNRVFRLRDPLTHPVVDVILGQTDLGGVACNRGGNQRVGMTLNTLCYPGPVSLDRKGNLYVSDHALEIQGNMRLLEFNKDLFPTDNTSVIFARDASKVFPNIATWEPAFDSQNRMVVGYNPYWAPNPGEHGRFPGIYNDPLSPTSTAPDSFLNDYYSMAVSATFDDNDNLYVGDLNRARVLIYKQPNLSAAPVSAPPKLSNPYFKKPKME